MAEDKTRLAVGPESLKAFAHPLRMAMYSALQTHGSATASQLGRLLGQSSGQTSYHLRQLERHGFVEDDPARTGGRERWWRAVGFTMDSPELLADPATGPAARVVLHQAAAERAAALNSWIDSLTPDSPEWVGTLSAATVVMTLEEVETFSEELRAFLEEKVAPWRGRELGEGMRRVRVHTDVFPLPNPGPASAEGPAELAEE